MNNTKKMLKGVFSPNCTPFINDKVDYTGLVKNIEKLNESGLKGYFVLGTNGEFKTLTEFEKFKVLETYIKYSSDDKVIMAGTGCESTYETIIMTKKASDMGAKLVSLLMPNFFAKKIDEDVMVSHIIEVADNSPVPVLLYNNPSVAAGVTITADVIKRVKDHPMVSGIKDSSKDTWPELVKFDSDDFSALAGSAEYFFDLLEAGGTGGVLSLANVFPDECARLYRLYTDGNMDEAAKLKDDLVSLNKKVSGSYGVAGVKYAMELAGFSGGNPRKPLKALIEDQKTTIEKDLRESGFLKVVRETNIFKISVKGEGS